MCWEIHQSLEDVLPSQIATSRIVRLTCCLQISGQMSFQFSKGPVPKKGMNDQEGQRGAWCQIALSLLITSIHSSKTSVEKHPSVGRVQLWHCEIGDNNGGRCVVGEWLVRTLLHCSPSGGGKQKGHPSTKLSESSINKTVIRMCMQS